MMPKVSVVVPTYRRPKLLDRCLAALLNQDLDAGEYDVWIVDDAAHEATRCQVEKWAQRFSWKGIPLNYLPTRDDRHGPAIARNLGWRNTSSDIIAFTDDDCIPSRQWLRRGLEAFGSDVAAVTGKIVMPLPPNPTDYEANASLLANAEFVTANCFCRRAALESTGGFDENFAHAWREDSDLQFSLLEKGCRIARAAEAVVVHPIRSECWSISLHQVRKSEYEALLYKKHPSLYREKILPGRAWSYYAILAGLLMAISGIVLGHSPLFHTGTAAWILLTAYFCLKRLQNTRRDLGHVSAMIVTSSLIPLLSIFYRIKGAVKYRVLFY